ncbi:MAG: YfhO family protein [Ferruginibacter sp.]
MQHFNFRNLVPHLIAIAIFLVVTVVFCKPGLEHDVVLKQSDATGWEGMSHQSSQYKEQHGHYPLWAVSMFAGMPAYQIYMEGAWSPLGIVNDAFQLWLPKPFNFFFLACIGFYILCMCLRIKPFPAILGSLAFAYSSFSPIIVTAGHDTQMLALAYAPAVMGAVIMIFDKKYISGFILTALFTALEIGPGHQQITYYLFLVLGAMSIAYIIRFLKNRQAAHLAKSLGLILLAGFIGVCANALVLLTSYDFAKDSKRGGQLVLDNSSRKDDVIKDGKTVGLSKDYAFQWSYGRAETFSLMFPGVKGYGSHMAQRDDEQYIFPKLDEHSNLAKFFVNDLNVPEDQAVNYALQESRDIYWGDQPFTKGPVYLGAVICFMFLFGMFYLDNKHKWWILAVSIFAILLSWGNHLPGFNYFMFDHLPLYNKFRVPTMTLVIPQLLFPVIAALVLNKLTEENDAYSWKQFKLGVIATAAVFACVSFFYMSSDFSKENKQRTTQFNKLYDSKDPSFETKMNAMNQSRELQPETDNQLYEAMLSNLKGSPEAEKKARELVGALREDRAAFLLSDITRSLVFVLITIAIIALYLKKKINAMLLVIGVTLVATIDLLGFGMKYLNDKSFDSKDKYEASEFPFSAADETILKDPDPNYRVYNTASLEESKTSYYHKSIGGYHPAKMGIYDDLMQYQLNGSPNIAVLNMLNAKYVIQQQGNNLVASRNLGALGNVWFVKGLKFVNGAVEEMKALYEFNPADTAVVDNKFKNLISAASPADSSSTIKQTVFDNDAITYKSSSTASHVAVFSEVYYRDWKAYIDGKPADFFKANYVLRAMVVPAGNHTIEFKFEPGIYYTGRNIANISTWILTVLLIGFIVYSIRNGLKKDQPVNKLV